MANKSPSNRRIANVAVPHDGGLFCQLLARGVGGQFASEFAQHNAGGYVPFERDVQPSAYSCADSFRRDYLLAVTLSKFDDGKSSELKKQVAIEKFLVAEEQCRLSNERLRRVIGGPLVTGLTIEAVLFTAARKISRLLGPLDLDEVALGFGFGPGSTTRLRRTKSDTWYKFSGIPEATTNCAVFADAVFQHLPLWKQGVMDSQANVPELERRLVTYVRGNRIVTVPKNAKTDRVIAIEPDMNMFVQKGFGAVIRSRLKRVGVDLDDQTVNQEFARQGSIDGSLATLDLSMASDTVSRGIVEALLPPDWLSALEQCRCQEGVLPSGEVIRYQKFSSMGNGFTFELESLIFWALISSVADLLGETDRRISVYGDDLIVPVNLVEPTIGALSFAGFTVNAKKSFWSGPFRESCGKHYFQGIDVTPFYIRKQPRRLSDVFLLHNNVVRWSVIKESGCRDSGLNAGLRDVCEALRSSVPRAWCRPRIPDGYGDGAFIGSFDECVPRRAPKGFCGWQAKVLVEPRLSSDRGGHSRLLKSLWILRHGDSRRDRQAFGFHGSERKGIVLPRGYPVGLRSVPRSYEFGVRQNALLDSIALAGNELFKLGISGCKSGLSEQSFEVPMDKRARVAKTLVRQWAELGPWI